MSVTNCLANIHSFLLRDCKQAAWAGDQSAEVQMVQVSINERKKEQIKHKQLKVLSACVYILLVTLWIVSVAGKSCGFFSWSWCVTLLYLCVLTNK